MISKGLSRRIDFGELSSSLKGSGSVRKSTKLLGGIFAAVICLSATAMPAMASSSTSRSAGVADGSSAPLPLSVSVQAAHENAVTSFLRLHPKPVLPTSASPAELAANRATLYTYLHTVPWTDVFGQWGCTVTDVSIQWTKDIDGTKYPSYSDSANCGGQEALAAVVGTIAPRSAILSESQDPSLIRLYPQLARTSGEGAFSAQRTSGIARTSARRIFA